MCVFCGKRYHRVGYDLSPKTGSDGVDNLTKEEYKSIAKEIMQALAGKSLFRLNCEKQVFEKP